MNPLRGFIRRHLFDYPPSAVAAWFAIAGAGGLALGWALWRVSHLPAAAGPLLLAIGLVALASSFAIKLPRSTYTLSVADVFIFGTLAALGTPAAVLAAGVEGAIGTARTSKRLSSRVSSPAAGMMAMSVCGWAFESTKALLPGLGLGEELAPAVALCLVAAVPFALTTIPLMGMMALKRGEPITPIRWMADAAVTAAIYLASALIAGLVHLNSQRFGPALLVVSAASTLLIMGLLRTALRRQETERQSQDAKIAEANREAERNQQRFNAAFSHAAVGMVIVNQEGVILQANAALCELLMLDPGELPGCHIDTALNSADAPLLQRRAEAALALADGAFSMELQARRADGADMWVAVHCGKYEDTASGGRCLIYQLHDITSRHVAEHRLSHIAHHDGLTDLANRHCFHERLVMAVERTRQDGSRRFALLFLDLDRFKVINDSLGHSAGNELLREVAARLRSCLGPGDLAARLGGDEFAVLLETAHEAEIGMRTAGRVLDELSRPVRIFGTEVVPSASAGITFSDAGLRTADQILRDADLAMYEAKAGGGGRVALFDRSMQEKVADKLALETDLRRAIGEGQLSMHFQPIYQLDPYRLVGFEALARWVHPQRGPVSPAVFIALAEESGYIEPLTDWVIDHAMAQLARWKKDLPGAQALGMHVNISGRDLTRMSLVGHVKQVLERHGATPGSLTLEITETTLMGRLDVALRTMGQLRLSDVRFSIDDFGTGFSSLSYLASLPIDSLKIDRSFVAAMQDKKQNAEIVRAVFALGQLLGHKVIAEGIETADQLATLRSMGVHEGQGYLLSRPLRSDQVADLLAVTETATN